MRIPARNADDSHPERGFSLVELMVVVAIIGTLASMAVPEFQRFEAKAKQSEAKKNLAAIEVLEVSYYGVYDVYYNNGSVWTQSMPGLGFQVEGHSRYNYDTFAVPGYYIAGAAANPASAIRAGCPFESWWIDPTNTIWSWYDCSVDP